MKDTTIVNSGCNYDCGGCCPLRIHVKNGKVIRIENAASDGIPYRGCLRGRANRQRLYHPERLKYPMKRTGERGAGKFERISWDEALDTVTTELKRVKKTYGNSAILYFSVAGGSGSHGILHGAGSGMRLLNMFGGCVRLWGNVSNQGAIFGSFATYGDMVTGNTRDDHLNSRLIIMWGWNPVDTIWDSGTGFTLQKAKEAGIKIICIDPRFSTSAGVLAHQWIPIVPGTDTAMLIAMAYIIIQENLQDQNFIDTYTTGFEKYRDYVMGIEDGQPKTPHWAESITGVPAATIAELAREYATMKPAALVAGWAPGRTDYGEQYHRAAMVLAAITGNIGKHGGNAPGWDGAFANYMTMGKLGKGIAGLVDTGRKYRIPGYHAGTNTKLNGCEVWDAILKGKAGGYPVDLKLGYAIGTNPLSALPDANKGVAALKKLEFIVVHEVFMSATARFADILLPVNTFMEREDVSAAWLGAPYLVYANQCVDSLHESKTDLQICTELADRLEIKHYNDKTDREWLKEFLSTEDIPDFDEFRKKGIHIIDLEAPLVGFKKQIEDPENNPFPTHTGKIEIFSQLLADIDNPDIPPIPKWMDGEENRDKPLTGKYPLQFISTHFRRRVHSQLDNLDWLKDTEPHVLWLNPDDARARGINDGDPVKVINDRGKIIIPCQVTERIMPGVVHLPQGGPFSPDGDGIDRGGCANALTRTGSTPSGAFPVNTVLVEVQKA
ncbi:molybdopterin-dependent oxidoreductase [Thermodesulfobacteriota bacterium]